MIVLQERTKSGAKKEPIEAIPATINNSIYEQLKGIEM